jgi:hypothetical protein
MSKLYLLSVRCVSNCKVGVTKALCVANEREGLPRYMRRNEVNSGTKEAEAVIQLDGVIGRRTKPIAQPSLRSTRRYEV